MKYTQLPLMAILEGGSCPSDSDVRSRPSELGFQPSRDAAMREVALAYERALTLLDPRDHEEQAWFAERLRDARLAAGLDPPAPRPHVRD